MKLFLTNRPACRKWRFRYRASPELWYAAERMQRWSSLALGVLVLAAIGVVVVQTRKATMATPIASASASAAPEVPEIPDAGLNLAETEPRPDSDAGEGVAVLPDGRPVPELPPSAPKSVHFGVILVAYKGAQNAAKDAPSKEKALKLAEKLVGEAKTDFPEAVKKGDPGSTEEAGRMPRGVLEKPIEYLLFTLEKGAVYPEPLDTPRGYWILKRND